MVEPNCFKATIGEFFLSRPDHGAGEALSPLLSYYPCVTINQENLGSLTWYSFCKVNPFSKQHGAPSDAERHVGDLGNIQTDAQGSSKGSMSDDHIKLIGPESILGVSNVIPTRASSDSEDAKLIE